MTALEVSIARAKTDDAETVASLLHGLLDELANGAGPELPELQRTTRRLLGEGLVIGVIAYIEDQPAGIFMLNECAAIYAGGRFGEITEMFVVPAHRSNGIAPVLIEEARQIARERGWGRLEVGAPDQPAWNRTLGFYLREGFEEVGPRLRLLI